MLISRITASIETTKKILYDMYKKIKERNKDIPEKYILKMILTYT